MSLRVLIAPDKFKGSLTAHQVAAAIAKGWQRARHHDVITLLPMSDGGDGFGEVIGTAIKAKTKTLKTIDAAHRPHVAEWRWEPKTKTAIVESARVIGLGMLPKGQFHPFQLDSTGLGQVLLAAAKQGATRCIVGLGGSATNDAGFGMARALGWKFLRANGAAITQWTDLDQLAKIIPPKKRKLFRHVTVAVDVQNPLLGARGCSRIYGPQKGLRPEDFPKADACMKQLVKVLKRDHALDFSKTPGAGAAGGLGFAVPTFLGGQPESGFEIVAAYCQLRKHLAKADLVITGEGALDRSTTMGKGVGEIALLCKKSKVPCLGFSGFLDPVPALLRRFDLARGLTPGFVTTEEAFAEPEFHLARLAEKTATEISAPCACC
ncbi:MAG: glycerate kinase [Verrucomicrobia bacterium]|nr:glycerate kinase [Verrucomicrobiota bacterium]